MTKQEFVEKFNRYFENEEISHVAVYVQLPDLVSPEVIVNPRVNMLKKLEYYEKSYNENMQLNTFGKIRIFDLVGFKNADWI